MPSFQSTDALTNLSQLLPTGTFLTFQALAPIFTNNGDCGRIEKIVTGILLGFFFALCFGLSFVDSITTDDGTVIYGIVTNYGLFNPKFSNFQYKDKTHGEDQHPNDNFYDGKDDGNKYHVKWVDAVNGALNVIVFGALSCLTPPITSCYYPRISQTLVKTGPILVSLFVGVLFAIFPTGRHGVGFAATTDGGFPHFVPSTKASGTDGGANGSSNVPNGGSNAPVVPDVEKNPLSLPE